MSTYVYLECLDHDPPLRAEDESGQHLYDLPQIRADLANRQALVAAWEDDWTMDDYFRRNTIRFLARHPKCHIGIRDECGVEHETTPFPPGESCHCDRTESALVACPIHSETRPIPTREDPR